MTREQALEITRQFALSEVTQMALTEQQFKDLMVEVTQALPYQLARPTVVCTIALHDPVTQLEEEIPTGITRVRSYLRSNGRVVGSIALELSPGERLDGSELLALELIAQQLAPQVLIRTLERQLDLDVQLQLLHATAFIRQATQELRRCRSPGKQKPCAVAFIDLDKLWKLNEYGHQVGDQALEHVARVIKTSADRIGHGACAARFGKGDEMALLLPGVNQAEAVMVGKAIIEEIQCARAFHNGHALPFTVSIGTAVFPEDAVTVPALLDCADQAVQWAKSEGGNCLKTFAQVRELDRNIRATKRRAAHRRKEALRQRGRSAQRTRQHNEGGAG